jgi:hypothetical protein
MHASITQAYRRIPACCASLLPVAAGGSARGNRVVEDLIIHFIADVVSMNLPTPSHSRKRPERWRGEMESDISPTCDEMSSRLSGGRRRSKSSNEA